MELAPDTAPEHLTSGELIDLALVDSLQGNLREKFERLLTTPFISNEAAGRGISPKRPCTDLLGPFLRMAFWNIARGERLDRLLLALSGDDKLLRIMEGDGFRPGSEKHRSLAEALRLLRDVDVIALNEVDIGLSRSGYRNVVKEVAERLDMNYAFGVEFVELAPLGMAAQDRRYRGLHGNAVLSRYPIRRASVVPFIHQGYDWYAHEKQMFSTLPGIGSVRDISGPLQQAWSFCQLRRGGRMALIVECVVPDLIGEALTVVSTHLENRAPPSLRVDQMRELLAHLHGLPHPVILAGDLNTSGSDGRPNSRHAWLVELTARGRFWGWLAPRVKPWLSRLNDLQKGFSNWWEVERDPLTRGSFSNNEEYHLFHELMNFRFQDGYCFDFRGDRNRSSRGVAGLLGNSNERTRSGFTPTAEPEWVLGPVGKSKLDWIFVKPCVEAPADTQSSYRFAPHFGRILQDFGFLSDHRPMLVDLPLAEPRI